MLLSWKLPLGYELLGVDLRLTKSMNNMVDHAISTPDSGGGIHRTD